MKSFTFYRSFYETMKKIRKREDKEKISFAILEYMFDGIEPTNLKENCEIAFASFRELLDLSRVRAISASKSKSNQNEIKTESNEIKTESNANQMKSNANQMKSNFEKRENSSMEKETKEERSKEKNKEKDITLLRENIPPTPQGAGETDLKPIFFERYPAMQKCAKNDDGIDYGVLLQEFEKSSILRGIYSFSKIVSMYPAIKRGDFRDKQAGVNQAIEALNEKAAREKWYADKQAKAESIAYAYQKRARADKRYCDVERELGKMNLELAKAEILGGDLVALKEYKEQLQEERANILKKLQIDEKQLLPKYDCDKCNDSGFLSDGRACDCYKKEVSI